MPLFASWLAASRQYSANANQHLTVQISLYSPPSSSHIYIMLLHRYPQYQIVHSLLVIIGAEYQVLIQSMLTFPLQTSQQLLPCTSLGTEIPKSQILPRAHSSPFLGNSDSFDHPNHQLPILMAQQDLALFEPVLLAAPFRIQLIGMHNTNVLARLIAELTRSFSIINKMQLDLSQ
jgi:hypothetical protein